MATPRPLRHPPIVEALVDLRTPVSGDQAAFDAFATSLRTSYPKRESQKQFAFQLQVRDGVLVPGVQTSEAFGGVRIKNDDETMLVQARPDGFTVNNVKTYVGGDALLSEAGFLWEKFVAHFRPDTVSRVALRYINRFDLPLMDGDDIDRYLVKPVEMPPSGPQGVSEFLSRVVGHDSQNDTTAVVVRQMAPRSSGSGVSVILDIDVFRQGSFGIGLEQILAVLGELRAAKNNVFFSSLEEEAIALFEGGN